MSKKKGDEEGILQADAPKDGTVVDLSTRVKVRMNGTSPQHADGEETEMSPLLAQKVEKNGWGTIISMIALCLCFALGTVSAQNVMYNPLPASGALAKSILSDTVTNAGTSYLTSYAQTRTQSTTTAFSVVCTKISGTVAGTITLQGSLDGVNFKAIPTVDTQTSITTATALDVASQVFVWRIANCPFTYYRVSWTGTGTMAASFTARLIAK